ncbi:hypothetical protein NQ317_010031 [Molorchus minor]|uniref:EGF domain-specific O-linked N-acetylglucosamine transferase n=1 Tax=Molorchus minor TaxID=1323400 RepID=A0ABQ9J632_9CUCU|nr:hypothetical protein NQ317_010031 [Molorchus minor]
MYIVFLVVLQMFQVMCNNYSFINLPEDHLPYYFSNFPNIAETCMNDIDCPYKEHVNNHKCWGYEYGCKWKKQYSIPACPGDHKGWVKTKFAQQMTFYTQADFGFIKQQLQEMQVLCEPLFPNDSSLECSEHLRFCRGRNIMLNFTKLINREEPIRYKMDVLNNGDIGDKQTDHLSPLQSWGPEMRYFTRLKHRPIVQGDCDIIIEKPTFIMKIDATVNMYHHFCDFLNLYASLHVNASQYDAFSTDVHIMIWETYTYHSAFHDTWEAFTDHPIWDLKTFRGKTVCFKNVVFPLLPRMIFGLYYNTPIIYGCQGSGLFEAFSKHILHRLKIPIHKREDQRIHITFLSRKTMYRRVLNEDKLLEAIKENDNYLLEISRNSDVFIGIHGAGLTHLLFLPEWAAVFELYNCEDASCYFDLARLKGVKYITWEDNQKLTTFEDESYDGGAHAKFANYSFDVEEFIRLVEKAAKHVKNHKKFQEYVGSSINHAKHDEL